MSIEKKANHQVNIVRITEILTHTNANSLEIIPIGEYQAVSRKGQFKVGDLAPCPRVGKGTAQVCQQFLLRKGQQMKQLTVLDGAAAVALAFLG
jgi:hypothetical protein